MNDQFQKDLAKLSKEDLEIVLNRILELLHEEYQEQ